LQYPVHLGKPLKRLVFSIKTIKMIPLSPKSPFLSISILARCSLLGAVALLAANQFVSPEVHRYLSSAPLVLAGLGYTLLQIGLRPPRLVLLKRLVLAASFLMWAVVQLLSPGRIAVFLGDAVIAAYVLDLYWMMQDQRQTEIPRGYDSAATSFERDLVQDVNVSRR
jgi:hypothetical protein